MIARVMTATITKSAEMEATLPETIRSRNRVIPTVSIATPSVLVRAPRLGECSDGPTAKGWRCSRRPGGEAQAFPSRGGSLSRGREGHWADPASGHVGHPAGRHAVAHVGGRLFASHLCDRGLAECRQGGGGVQSASDRDRCGRRQRGSRPGRPFVGLSRRARGSRCSASGVSFAGAAEQRPRAGGVARPTPDRGASRGALPRAGTEHCGRVRPLELPG